MMEISRFANPRLRKSRIGVSYFCCANVTEFNYNAIGNCIIPYTSLGRRQKQFIVCYRYKNDLSFVERAGQSI